MFPQLLHKMPGAWRPEGHQILTGLDKTHQRSLPWQRIPGLHAGYRGEVHSLKWHC